MTDTELLANVPGARAVFDWFGYWPMLHDAEVISLDLHRSMESRLVVHGFEMTSAVDARGYFVLEKHATITFGFSQVTNCDLKWFNNQNVLFDLDITKEGEEFVLTMSTSYGLEGTIRSKGISVGLQPGIPEDSRYKQQLTSMQEAPA